MTLQDQVQDQPVPEESDTATATPFADLGEYIALPRISGLTLSSDGTRLVTAVATLDPKRTRYVTALWEVDPAGVHPARRLTRSAKGESGAAFLPDGSLLFTSARPDPDREPAADEDPKAALWLLPAGGGEARPLAARPGGVSGVVVARRAGTVLVASPTMPAAASAEDDAQRRKDRTERKVTAILHESYPIRYWDHDLGPECARLLVADPPDPADDAASLELRDLTGHCGRAIGPDSDWDLSPDGRLVVAAWSVAEAAGSQRYTLVAIDVATGARRTLLDDPDREYAAPAISPDGSRVAVVEHRRPSATRPLDARLLVLDLATGETAEVAPGWDRWPAGRTVWTPDGSALLVVADEGGRAPVFLLDLNGGRSGADGTPRRLTGDHGAYSDVVAGPDGRSAYAVRAAVDAAPAVVRLDLAATDQRPVALPSPVPTPELPGHVTEVDTTASDGTPLRAWLALPEAASPQRPAPLLVWVHGGPLSSWNSWSWRWNPWIAVARGYAVLLPDPALSTGYGLGFIGRSWGRWGAEPYTDVMALTDAAQGRDEIDAARIALMGGSFGGYLANWIAGHTDRYAAIVSHASLWALDQFGPTTDGYHYWRRELSPSALADFSPHRFVDRIRTPMLIIHGDRDYRVPIGEGLRLWAELAEQAGGPDGSMPHKFLYFSDEGHWILAPQHTIVWYETVFAFLDHHLLGREWVVPDVLR